MLTVNTPFPLSQLIAYSYLPLFYNLGFETTPSKRLLLSEVGILHHFQLLEHGTDVQLDFETIQKCFKSSTQNITEEMD